MMFVYWAGWAILARFGAISTPSPIHSYSANIAIALAVPVAVTGLTAAYGLRHLRWWSSWPLGAYSLALFSQFVLLAYNDQQRGEPKLALLTAVFEAMPLMPVVALWRLDLRSLLSKDYARAVADTPHIHIKAKLPLAVRRVMALLLLILIGSTWSMLS